MSTVRFVTNDREVPAWLVQFEFNIGISPSGKARDFDSRIRKFEPSYPSQDGTGCRGRKQCLILAGLGSIPNFLKVKRPKNDAVNIVKSDIDAGRMDRIVGEQQKNSI